MNNPEKLIYSYYVQIAEIVFAQTLHLLIAYFDNLSYLNVIINRFAFITNITSFTIETKQ